jgi:hypothetical protein
MQPQTAAFAAEAEPPVARPSIDGTWRWSFTMPDGTVSSPKLTLTTDEGGLTGTCSVRTGDEQAITQATLRGDQLRFQVIRQREGQTVTTTYTGRWSGKIIHGSIESNWSGVTKNYPWTAERKYEGAEGTWRWQTVVRGQAIPFRLVLTQSGEKLTGYMPLGGRRRLPISHGQSRGSDITFELDRSTPERGVTNLYQGKLSGDRIVGTVATLVDGARREAPWEAKRQP